MKPKITRITYEINGFLFSVDLDGTQNLEDFEIPNTVGHWTSENAYCMTTKGGSHAIFARIENNGKWLCVFGDGKRIADAAFDSLEGAKSYIEKLLKIEEQE